MAEELFNEDERDVLGETINIAMGKAGAALAQTMAGHDAEVYRKISSVSAADLLATRQRLEKTYERISVLEQEFFGELAGRIAVVYGPASYAALRNVLGFDDRDGDGRRQREELLLELGNALASTCINEVSALLEMRTGLRPPRVMAFDIPTSTADWHLFADLEMSGQMLLGPVPRPEHVRIWPSGSDWLVYGPSGRAPAGLHRCGDQLDDGGHRGGGPPLQCGDVEQVHGTQQQCARRGHSGQKSV